MSDRSSVALAAQTWAHFAELSSRHPAVLLLAQSSRLKRLKRGDVLVEESDDGADVFLVASGHVRTIRILDNGQEVWLADAGPGELIGELAALTGQMRTSTVVAATDLQIFAIERAVFLSVAGRHGEVALEVARLLARRLIQTSGQMADLFGKSVAYRVHRELVRLGVPSRTPGELVRLPAPPTITDLRQRVHASREATSRAMSELEERGLVIRKNGLWIVMSLPDDQAGAAKTSARKRIAARPGRKKHPSPRTVTKA
jgi:CRP/FNR family transcriptional regulator, cyclic AMP receptor protein